MNEHTDLVRDSFERLSSDMERVSERFFTNVLARDPSLKAIMDRGDPGTSRTALRSGLGAVIANLDRPLVLESILFEIGRQHRQLGMQPGHLGIALDSLLFAIRDVYPGDWTNELEQAWVEVAAVIMEHMQRGLRASPVRETS